jgi:HK97 family phage prohead protease
MMRIPKNIERRAVDEEIRYSGRDRLIEGYALVFNSKSNPLGGDNFFEIIRPEALTVDVLNRSDIFAKLDHDDFRGILARSKFGKGTLELEIDEKGLKYKFQAPKTALGDEVLEYLQRGDITGSSFAFTVAENGAEMQTENGVTIRYIKSFHRLYDVSPVFSPAYDETSVGIAQRALDEFVETNKTAEIEAEKRAQAEAAEAEAAARAVKIEAYYKNLKQCYKL